MTTTEILLFACLLLIGSVALWCGRELYRTLKEEIRELKERLRKFEEAPLSMPYTLRRKIEDIGVTVAVYRTLREQDDALLETLSEQLAQLHTPNHKTK